MRDSFDRNDLEEAAEGADRAMELQARLEGAGIVFTSDCVRRILGVPPEDRTSPPMALFYVLLLFRRDLHQNGAGALKSDSVLVSAHFLGAHYSRSLRRFSFVICRRAMLFSRLAQAHGSIVICASDDSRSTGTSPQ